jgi:coenzyme PQQ biosynthesis protein PqqD
MDGAVAPRLASHARLRFDERRQAWVVLAPEKVIFPDEAAVDVLRRCDGTATVAAIAQDLAAVYDGDPQEIAADVSQLLDELAEQGVVVP